VSEGLACCLDARDTAQGGCEGVAGTVHIHAGADAKTE
jgi:hypothetical protein